MVDAVATLAADADASLFVVNRHPSESVELALDAARGGSIELLEAQVLTDPDIHATNAIDDQPLPLYGDGLQMRDYQFVLDHCEGIDVVLQKDELGEIYNLGTGTESRL